MKKILKKQMVQHHKIHTHTIYTHKMNIWKNENVMIKHLPID